MLVFVLVQINAVHEEQVRGAAAPAMTVFHEHEPGHGARARRGDSPRASLVHLRRPRSARALDDVSLTVRRGEMIVVMGATGAGKSTLAKCLNRTIPAFQAGR